jgi:hypothetical protein
MNVTFFLLSLAPACIDYSFGGKDGLFGGDSDTGDGASETMDWPPDSECSVELPSPAEVGVTDTCTYEVGAFNPIAEWTAGPGLYSWSAAAVADLDGDGFPEVITTFADSLFGFGGFDLMGTSTLYVLNGDGTTRFTVPGLDLGMATSPAVADVTGDGVPEIFVVVEYANSLLAEGDYTVAMLDTDGNLVWESDHFIGLDFDYATSISISDMDHDGSAEIVAGRVILNADGTTRGQGEHGRGSYGIVDVFGLVVSEATHPVIADLDLDGVEEVITGNAFYDPDGNTLWADLTQDDAMIAVANLDDDPEGEFVAVSYNTVRAVDTDGTLMWGPIRIQSANIMSPPAIGDIDNDGYPEILTAGGNQLLALNHDGTALWTAKVTDESGATGASIFDFEGDGWAEVVYIDEVEMVAYDGLTGAVKFYNSDHSSNTMMDCPIIADVDADGHAEILVAHASLGGSALTAFGDRDDSWAPARKVWNQHAYTITNINDDLTVPTTATQNFTTFNSFKSAIDRLPGESLGWELESEISDVCEDDCDTGSVWVVAQILNKSEDDQAAGVNVTLYGLNGGDRLPLQTLQTSDVVPSGMSSEALLFEIDPVLLNDIDGFLLMADDDGSGTGFVSECNEDNNDYLFLGPFCQ